MVTGGNRAANATAGIHWQSDTVLRRPSSDCHADVQQQVHPRPLPRSGTLRIARYSSGMARPGASGECPLKFDLEQVDHLLTTTRAVRRRLDLERPVEMSVVLACLDLALQAPNGSNRQSWRFMLVTDATKKRAIADLCREASGGAGERLIETARAEGDRETERLYLSAVHLLKCLEDIPLLAIACYVGKPGHFADNASMANASLYGSVFPAIWSFQLALRSRGLGSSITTLHLLREREIAELLGIPEDVTQIAMLPIAYTKGGDFRRASRQPAAQVSFLDTWGAPITGTP